MKRIYGILSFVILPGIIYFALRFCSRRPYVTNDIRTTVIITLFLSVCLGLYVLYLFVRPTSFAMIQDEGIHIFSPKNEELALIPWESVKMCKRVSSEGRFSYLMLIFQFDATYAKHPVALCKEGQRPAYEEVWQHRLDECMDKLSRGTLTEEEFKQIPYLLLAPCKNHLFERCIELWKAKTRTEKKTEADSLS